MKTEITNTYEHASSKLINILNKFSEDDLNKIPFAESWTAAQVADHIIKSQNGISNLLSGKTEIADRDPLEKKEMIKTILLDLSKKMKSPEFILPSEDRMSKNQITADLSSQKTEILAAVTRADLAFVCAQRSLPGLGTMTGYEWMWFLICHMQRHTQQVENIFKVLNQQLTSEQPENL